MSTPALRQAQAKSKDATEAPSQHAAPYDFWPRDFWDVAPDPAAERRTTSAETTDLKLSA